MTNYPAWTPAARPGLVPLYPLTFGTILGRSFSALRHNPKVLLGFGIGIQALAGLIAAGAVVGLTFLLTQRLANVDPTSSEAEALAAGTAALMAVGAFVIGIGALAIGVIVQGIVVADVSRAILAEKPTLGEVWRTLKPSFWRLVGYTVLIPLAIGLAVLILILLIAGLAALDDTIAVWAVVALLLAAIPLSVWIGTKLFIVVPVIVIERTGIFAAIARSWRLTKGRFWSTFGVAILISLIFGAVAQVAAIPLGFASMGIVTTVAPTGEPDAQAVVTLLVSTLAAQAIILLIQAVAMIVQSSAAAIVYADCRMRHEGLHLDLLSYIDGRDSSATPTTDPYLVGIGRVVPIDWAPPVTPQGPPTNAQYGYPPPIYAAAPPGPATPAYGPPPGYSAAPPPTAPVSGPPPGYGAAPPTGGSVYGPPPEYPPPPASDEPGPDAPDRDDPETSRHRPWTAP